MFSRSIVQIGEIYGPCDNSLKHRDIEGLITTGINSAGKMDDERKPYWSRGGRILSFTFDYPQVYPRIITQPSKAPLGLFVALRKCNLHDLCKRISRDSSL